MGAIKEYLKLYREIKQRIIRLELPPESRIDISALIRDFGVSRTPLKEALILLQAEGWVLSQGSSFLVTPLSLDRLREITDIRLIVEVQALLWAARQMTPDGLARLKELEAEMDGIEKGADYWEMMDLDYRFHRHLFQAAGNRQLAEYLERLLNHYLRFWMSIPREMDPAVFFINPKQTLRAVETRDEDELIRLGQEHILGSVREIMNYFLDSPARKYTVSPKIRASGPWKNQGPG